MTPLFIIAVLWLLVAVIGLPVSCYLIRRQRRQERRWRGAIDRCPPGVADAAARRRSHLRLIKS